MEKIGRNDPCVCGSGKKYKQCCLAKKGGSGVKRKITAKWLNPSRQIQAEGEKEELSLMDRAFGHAAHSSEDAFQAIMPKMHHEASKEAAETENSKEK